MTMLIVRIVTVPQPLLQLAVLSNLHWRKLGERRCKTRDVSIVLTKNTGGSNSLSQHVEDYLVVHGRASRHRGMLTDGPMLRRYRRCCDKPMVGWMFTKVVQQEIGSTLHHGIIVTQQLLITRKQVLLPDMRRQPGTTRGEHSPCRTVDRSGNTPQVSIMMSHPTFTAIHSLSCLGTRLTEVTNHGEQGFLVLHEVTHQRWPVVHLRIDIDGVLRVPHGIGFVVPYTLQVSSLTTRL